MHRPPCPGNLLYLIVFIEGFCSPRGGGHRPAPAGAHVGSAIVVTGADHRFLPLALALGYASGAKVSERFTQVVARNFLISALLAGWGWRGLRWMACSPTCSRPAWPT